MNSDSDSLSELPDAIEPIVGYRAWELYDDDDGTPVLRSLYSALGFRGQVWVPGWNWAACTLMDMSDEATPSQEVPLEGCSCGFYAVKDLERVPRRWTPYEQGRRNVVGKVELAGKIIEHDDGYRAERARIVEILPAPEQYDVAPRVASEYGAVISNELRDATERAGEAERSRVRPRPVASSRPVRTSPWVFILSRLLWLLVVWFLFGHANPGLAAAFVAVSFLAVAWVRFDRPRPQTRPRSRT